MGAFNKQDLKELVQLAGAFKRAHFKEVSPGEVVAIANALTFISTLAEKIELSIKQVDFNAAELLKSNQLVAELDAKLKEPVKKAKK